MNSVFYVTSNVRMFVKVELKLIEGQQSWLILNKTLGLAGRAGINPETL